MNVATLTHLPKVISRLQELQLSIEFWQKCYAEAGAQAEEAWEQYDAMIDGGKSYTAINDFYEAAAMFEDISLDAWRNWQEAKRQLLELSN